jgi:putative transposase
MNLVEQHIVKKGNESFKELDNLCLTSKDIYNSVLYIWRQELIKNGKFIPSIETYSIIKKHPAYKQIPQNIAVSTFNLVYQNIRSYFAALKSFKKNPSKFNGKPRLPKYKDSENGRYVAIFNSRVLPKKEARRDGMIRFTGLKYSVKSSVRVDDIIQVRFVPQGDHIVVEIIYEKEEFTEKLFNGNCAGIDIGLNNLATVTSNIAKPFIINGRPLKSINQFFNKRKANKLSILEKRNKKKISKKIKKLQAKRNNKIKDYLHKASKEIINFCLEKDITLLVIGKNNDWKQSLNLGAKTNQNFVSIPHTKFIDMLKYKCKLNGISVKVIEESYTSKCSFIDNEKIKKQESYMGQRRKRGLFISKNGIKINADCNGSYNILRKVVQTVSYTDLLNRGLVVSPVIIKITN